MHRYTFLDWRPVSALPVCNGLWKRALLGAEEIKKIVSSTAVSMQVVAELSVVSFVVRQDGVFVFSIKARNPIDHRILSILSRSISNFIKTERLMHVHEWHEQDKSYAFRRTLSKNFLEVEPVPVCRASIVGSTGVLDFSSLMHFDLVKHVQADKPAMLVLRSRHLYKKGLSIKYIEDDKKRNEDVLFSWVIIILSYSMVMIFSWYLINGMTVTDFIVFNVAALSMAFSVYNYLHVYFHRIPTIVHLRKTIGFFTYTNVYSRIVSEDYLGTEKAGVNFSSAIDTLSQRLAGESQAMDGQRDLGRLFLTVSSVTLAFIALAIKLLG